MPFIETEDMLSYLDILSMVEKIEAKKGKYDYLFIDPWNALTVDYTEVDRKLNTYQYTLQVTTKLQKWCKHKNMSLYIGMHSNTESARRIHQSGDLKGNPSPLNAADLADGVCMGKQMHTHVVGTQIQVRRRIKESNTGSCKKG